MDNNNITETDYAEIVAIKKMWDSKAGKSMIKRLELLKEQNQLGAMNTVNTANPADVALVFTSRAAGIQIVLDEINRCKQIVESRNKKEGGSESQTITWFGLWVVKPAQY